MNNEKALNELARRNPFWVCFAVFLLLACHHGFGLAHMLQQRQQLDKASLLQKQNLNTLSQARQLETRLEALSLELIHIAGTNANARQIVQDFNIQWNPDPGAAPTPPLASKTKK